MYQYLEVMAGGSCGASISELKLSNSRLEDDTEVTHKSAHVVSVPIS